MFKGPQMYHSHEVALKNLNFHEAEQWFSRYIFSITFAYEYFFKVFLGEASWIVVVKFFVNHIW